MSTQGPMVRPRVPQGLPPGSSLPRAPGSLGPSNFKASRLQGSSSKGRPKVSRLARGRSLGPVPAARARGSGPGRAQHLGPEFGAPGPRGPGAPGPGLSVLWRCVVSPEPRGLGLGLGPGPRPGARGSGPGPEARRAKGRWAQGPGPGTGAPNTQPLCFKAALTIYLTGISSSWRLPHP